MIEQKFTGINKDIVSMALDISMAIDSLEEMDELIECLKTFKRIRYKAKPKRRVFSEQK